MKNLLLLLFATSFQFVLAQTPCVGGTAGGYPCSGYDLQSHIPLSVFNSPGANDSWGWTDPLDSKEYVLMGLEDGTAFIDISDPINPVYLGKLPTATGVITWRDVKVYQNYMFVVSEAAGHGMQIFDLTKLRNVTNPPVTFSEDAHYSGFGSAHNVVINEDTGYAYGVGTDTFNGGAHFVDISNPLAPVAAGGFGGDGYTHDAQVVVYTGPDGDHTGKEIYIGSAGSDQIVSIVDVTNKNNPVSLATLSYSDVGYTHQAWFTEDQRYLLLGDEFDETNVGYNTRTVIFDLLDLDNPVVDFEYFGPTSAIDHNGYVKGDRYFLSNYAAGMREIDISDIGNGNMSELAYFDTYTSNNSANYDGVWNVYPYFGSGNIMINDRSGGFFLVKASATDNTNPIAVCQDYTASLDINGEVIVAGSSVDGGSSDNSGSFVITLSQNMFDCSHIGTNVVTVTVTDPSGNVDNCTATITVVDDLVPTMSCPTNDTVLLDVGSNFYTLPNYVLAGDVTAVDNCTTPLVIEQDPPSGAQISEGIHTIYFITGDTYGNDISCSFELTVSAIAGIEDRPFEEGLRLFPIPATNELTIASETRVLETISVFDLTGKVIFETNKNNTQTYILDISAFANGMYFVQLNNELTKRIIKQ